MQCLDKMFRKRDLQFNSIHFRLIHEILITIHVAKFFFFTVKFSKIILNDSLPGKNDVVFIRRFDSHSIFFDDDPSLAERTLEHLISIQSHFIPPLKFLVIGFSSSSWDGKVK